MIHTNARRLKSETWAKSSDTSSTWRRLAQVSLFLDPLILDIHRLTIDGLYNCAGQFRTTLHHVRVNSTTFSPAAPYEIEYRVQDLIDEYQRRQRQTNRNELNAAVRFFHQFLKIHPFCGGNGRVARTLLNIMLRRAKLLPQTASVHYYLKQRNDHYLDALQFADRGNYRPLRALIGRACTETNIDVIADALRETGQIQALSAQSRRLSDVDARLRLRDPEFFRAAKRFALEAVVLLEISDLAEDLLADED